MKRRGLKIFLDVALTVTLVFEMFYMYTGNFLHEVVGMLFFVTLIIHIVLTRKWVGGVMGKLKSHKRTSFKQKAMLVVAVLIGVIGGLLLVSSLLISNVLASFTGVYLTGSVYAVASYMHTLLAYALCGAAVIHVALHWASLFNVMSIPYDASKRNAINVGISSVAAVGFIALGATAARALDVVPGNSGTQNSQGNGTQNGANGSSNDSNALNGTNSFNDGSNAGNAPDASSTPGKQRGIRNRNGIGSASNTESNSGSNASPNEGSNSGSGSSPNVNSGSGSDSSSNGTSNSSSGICTLCHKQCPLSAPQCNKPYAAGLL